MNSFECIYHDPNNKLLPNPVEQKPTITELAAQYRSTPSNRVLIALANQIMEQPKGNDKAHTLVEENVHNLILDEAPSEEIAKILFFFDEELFCIEELVKTNRSNQEIKLFLKNLEAISQYESTSEKDQININNLISNNTNILSILGEQESCSKSIRLSHIFSEVISSMVNEKFSTTVKEFSHLTRNLTSPEIAALIRTQSSENNKLEIATLLRYNQLTAIPDDHLSLSKREKLGIAFFIEGRILGIKRTKNRYFKKEDGLPRSLQYDFSQKATHILIKTHEKKTLHEVGGSKKVTAAIPVPNDTNIRPGLIAQAVNDTSYENKCSHKKFVENSKALSKGFDKMVKESDLHKIFSGQRGIWPLLSRSKYIKQSPHDDEIPKLSLFMPMAQSDLFAVVKNKVQFSLDTLIDVMDQIACGLQYLHSRGFFHRDVKPENILFMTNPDGTVTAGLSDFGSTFNVNNQQKLPYLLRHGYYGTVSYTAPELFANKNFTRDLFKTEIWALGYSYYLLLLKKEPNWIKILQAQRKTLEAVVDDQTKIAMYDGVVETIEKARNTLIKKTDRSLEEECTLLIYDMMRIKPDLRLNIDQVIERIADLKAKSLALNMATLSMIA